MILSLSKSVLPAENGGLRPKPGLFGFWILFLLLSVSCQNKDCVEVDAAYHFEVPAQLTPKVDSMRVGDTLYLESIFQDRVFERKTGMKYHLADFTFAPLLYLFHLDHDPYWISPQGFEVLSDSANSFYPAAKGHAGSYQYQDGQYSLRVRIVPQKAGLFMLSFGSASELYGDQDFPGKCGGKGVLCLVALNGGTGNNIELLTHAADTAFTSAIMGNPQRRFYDRGSYCFYVYE